MWNKIKTQFKRFKNWIIFGVLGTGIVVAGIVALEPNIIIGQSIIDGTCQTITDNGVKAKIDGKSIYEQAVIKSQEFEKLKCIPKTQRDNYYIEVIEINVIGDSIEVFVKAWTLPTKGLQISHPENGTMQVIRDIPVNTQLGFGLDGTVEIERFTFKDPSIMVSDGTLIPALDSNGDRMYIDGVAQDITGLKEDLKEALLQQLELALNGKVIIFGNEKIVANKIGNTTSCFFSASGANSPVDGFVADGTNASWTIAREQTVGDFARDDGTFDVLFAASATGGGNFEMVRALLLFNINSIAGNEDIASSSLSLIHRQGPVNDDSVSVEIVSGQNIASPSAVAVGDMDAYVALTPSSAQIFGSLVISSWNSTDGDQNLFLLDSDANTFFEDRIDNNSGIAELMARADIDNNNTEPSGFNQLRVYFADAGGVNRPMLCIDHSAPIAPDILRQSEFWFE